MCLSQSFFTRLLLLLTGLAPLGPVSRGSENATPPNIILILADDMGYSDIGATGSEIATPHLDELASEGLLFTHGYNASRCCPSRVALLTGQYQWDAGIGHMNSTRSEFPTYRSHLNRRTATIAELLRDLGYQTFLAGKWHLGDDREHWPDRRGFDQFYGTPTGGGLYFHPSAFYDRPVFHNGREVTPGPDWYSTDGFTAATIDFLRRDRDRSRPFFIYLAYIAPHFPLQAHESDIAKYADTYGGGYAAIREARFARQREIGLIPADSELTAPEHPRWSDVENPTEAARMMAVYAAQVDRLDQNIGKLRAALAAEDETDQTIIIFLSDNGASQVSFNRTPQAVIGSRDSNAAYGAWYNVSNTPYRLGKRQEHEGGILTPIVISWPDGVSDPGRRVREPVHVMDILPTCLEWAGGHYPATYRRHALDPLDGRSFASLLGQATSLPERTLAWEHEGNRALRRGDWKLVARHRHDWELYHLSDDPFEQDNLIRVHPEKASDLQTDYAVWARRHGVQPWPLQR